jgi:hypothetical protein
MTWNDSSHTWNIASYSLREFDGSGQKKSMVITKQDTTILLDVTPQDILQKSKSTEEMNFD